MRRVEDLVLKRVMSLSVLWRFCLADVGKMTVVRKITCENDQRRVPVFRMYHHHQGRWLLKRTAEICPPELDSEGLVRSIWLCFSDTSPSDAHDADQKGML